MPTIVDKTVAHMQAGRNEAGEAEPFAARNPITVDGSSCSDVLDSTNNIIIPSVALPLLSSISHAAFIPMGVAALPSPKKLAAMLAER